MMMIVIQGAFASWASLIVMALMCRIRRRLRRQRVVGFFHPYCAAGGGGERVLWVGLAALKDQKDRMVVYCGENIKKATLEDKVNDRFGIEVSNFELCSMKSRCLLEPTKYPVATLIGQSLGSMVVAVECIVRCPPDVFVDTTGFAFTYLIAYFLAGARIAAYVHYPTISTDMIDAVQGRRPAFNHRSFVAKYLTTVKLAYYNLFAKIYGLTGRLADAVAANSTWTKNHIAALWKTNVTIVYPPCDTEHLCSSSSSSSFGQKNNQGKNVVVASLAQFRPEKNHSLQLEAWALVPADVKKRATLIIAGATRHQGDEALLMDLQTSAKNDATIQFLVNAPRSAIVTLLRDNAGIGLHTMRFEHFGIAVVEMMAATAVPVAHASAGPLLDIVGTNRDRGFVCDSPQDYADALTLLIRDDALRDTLARQAHAFVKDRFSDKAFASAFLNFLKPLLLHP